MSLAERLAQRLAPAAPPATAARATSAAAARTTPTRSPRSGAACTGRCWRSSARSSTTRTLDQRELEQRVRQTLQDVLAARGDAADRGRPDPDHQEVLRRDPRPRAARALLRDPDVTEIMVNGPDQRLRRAGRPAAPGRRGASPTRATCAGSSTRSSPGSAGASTRPARWSTPGCPTAAGSTRWSRRSRSTASLLTIRKFAADPFTVDDLIVVRHARPRRWPTCSRACVRGRLNILISGGTGTGKTTTPERAVLVPAAPTSASSPSRTRPSCSCTRSTCCGWSPGRPTSRGAGEVTIRDLVRNALRMRPDRIVVGEVRDGAALDMLQAMNTGHDGSITTVHANSPRDSLARLETMVLMAGMDLPVRAIREQIAVRHRPDHPPDPAQGRQPADHPHHRGGRHGGRRHHAAGPLPVRLPGRGGRVRPVPRHAAPDRPAAAIPRPAGRPRHPVPPQVFRPAGARDA